jgi:RNA-directed DNA polymerase
MKGAGEIDKNLIERSKKFTSEPQKMNYYKIKKSNKKSYREIYAPNIKYRNFLKDLQRELEPYVEKNLSDNNFAYRKRISAHHCFKRIKEIVESGNIWVAKLDIKDFFDNIDKNILLSKSEKFLDKEAQIIIESIIKNPVIINERQFNRERGIMQGLNVSPLLSIIYLDDFDKYWSENNEHGRMVRYSDDILIFATGRKKAKKNLQIAKKLLRNIKLRCTTEGPMNLRQDNVEFLSFKHYLTADNQVIQLPTDNKIQILKQKWDEYDSKDHERFKQLYSYFYSYNTSPG